MLPNAHFGNPAKPINWRDAALADNTPDDDTAPIDTPEDVVEILGFDPLDEDDYEDGDFLDEDEL